MVGIKEAQQFLSHWGRHLRRILTPRMTVILEKSVNKLAKTYIVVLRLKDLGQLPPVQIPAGFQLSTVKPGHEQDFIHVMRQSLRRGADRNWFLQSFSKYPDYDPENLILIYRGKDPVAAAAAWQIVRRGENIGLLKDVGVIQDYQGRGLGRQVSLAALHRLRERGFQEVILKTHDFRIPAIGLYLSIGFEPEYNLWAGKRKWKKILELCKIPKNPGQ